MKMKDIYIFGSGGFAKEVAFLIVAINKAKLNYRLKGFIDVSPKEKIIRIGDYNYPILNESELNDVSKYTNACFAIGIGNPDVIKTLIKRFSSVFDFPNLIHPNFEALIQQVEFGRGNIVTAGCIFTIDIKIGSFNIFNLNCTIGHDSIIGDGNVINPGTQISGGVKIGNYNLIGTNTAILQYISLGDENVIGAGALLNKDLDNRKVAVGVPAKVIKFR